MRLKQKLEKVIWGEFVIDNGKEIGKGIIYNLNDRIVSEQEYNLAMNKMFVYSNEIGPQKEIIFNQKEYLPAIVRAEERIVRNMYFVWDAK